MSKRQHDPIPNMLAQAKKRAKTKGFDFNLIYEDIKIPDECPILEIKMEFNGDRLKSPSLDRIDNLKGYTKDNVKIISFEANALKRHYPVKVFENLVSYMKCE